MKTRGGARQGANEEEGHKWSERVFIDERAKKTNEWDLQARNCRVGMSKSM